MANQYFRQWSEAEFDEHLNEARRLTNYIEARMQEQADNGRAGIKPWDIEFERARDRCENLIGLSAEHLSDLDQIPSPIDPQITEIEGICATLEGYMQAMNNILDDPSDHEHDPNARRLAHEAEEFLVDARQRYNELRREIDE